MADVTDTVIAAAHVATLTRGVVAILGVIPANSGPQAPPNGGSGTGVPTRPASGQLWPRGDGVPRS